MPVPVCECVSVLVFMTVYVFECLSDKTSYSSDVFQSWLVLADLDIYMSEGGLELTDRQTQDEEVWLVQRKYDAG